MSDKTLDFEPPAGHETDAGAPTFEEALERLEAIVDELEAGDISLETSLTLFEEGIALSRRCNAKLEVVERRLEVLVKRADGGDDVEPLKDTAVDEEPVD